MKERDDQFKLVDYVVVKGKTLKCDKDVISAIVR